MKKILIFIFVLVIGCKNPIDKTNNFQCQNKTEKVEFITQLTNETSVINYIHSKDIESRPILFLINNYITNDLNFSLFGNNVVFTENKFKDNLIVLNVDFKENCKSLSFNIHFMNENSVLEGVANKLNKKWIIRILKDVEL